MEDVREPITFAVQYLFISHIFFSPFYQQISKNHILNMHFP